MALPGPEPSPRRPWGTLAQPPGSQGPGRGSRAACRGQGREALQEGSGPTTAQTLTLQSAPFLPALRGPLHLRALGGNCPLAQPRAHDDHPATQLEAYSKLRLDNRDGQPGHAKLHEGELGLSAPG